GPGQHVPGARHDDRRERSGPQLGAAGQSRRAPHRQAARPRAQQGGAGPLHVTPIMLRGNTDPADGMTTTAGSLALVGDPPHQDATVAARLRVAGAVILGKTNLSGWANFRGFNSTSGWSGQGGQTRNPYVLDRNPCGSSSGS